MGSIFCVFNSHHLPWLNTSYWSSTRFPVLFLSNLFTVSPSLNLDIPSGMFFSCILTKSLNTFLVFPLLSQLPKLPSLWCHPLDYLRCRVQVTMLHLDFPRYILISPKPTMKYLPHLIIFFLKCPSLCYSFNGKDQRQIKEPQNIK